MIYLADGVAPAADVDMLAGMKAKFTSQLDGNTDALCLHELWIGLRRIQIRCASVLRSVYLSFVMLPHHEFHRDVIASSHYIEENNVLFFGGMNADLSG